MPGTATNITPQYSAAGYSSTFKIHPIFTDHFTTDLLPSLSEEFQQLEMWAIAQRDGRPAKYRWRPLFNAAKSG